jgi:hypothetical protein
MLVHTSRAIQKSSIVHLQKRVNIHQDPLQKPAGFFKEQTVIKGKNARARVLA